MLYTSTRTGLAPGICESEQAAWQSSPLGRPANRTFSLQLATQNNSRYLCELCHHLGSIATGT